MNDAWPWNDLLIPRWRLGGNGASPPASPCQTRYERASPGPGPAKEYRFAKLPLPPPPHIRPDPFPPKKKGKLTLCIHCLRKVQLSFISMVPINFLIHNPTEYLAWTGIFFQLRLSVKNSARELVLSRTVLNLRKTSPLHLSFFLFFN